MPIFQGRTYSMPKKLGNFRELRRPLSGEICISYRLPSTPFLLARTLSTAHVLPQRGSLLSTISGNVIINNVELSKNGLIMFLWEFVIYTFQDLKTQFISFKLMFWHAWLAFHQQCHPHLSWHLCGPAKSSAQQDLGTQIIDDPVFLPCNSTDRVRCHPWSALIFWNAKIKQYAWPPSTFPMDPTHQFFPSYTRKLYTLRY